MNLRGAIARLVIALPLACPTVFAATAQEDLEQLFPELKTAIDSPAKKTPPPAPYKSFQPHQPFRLSGSFREQGAWRVAAPQQMTQLRSMAYLAGTGAWTDAWSYKTSGWAWYDAVYDLTHHYPQPVEDDQKIDAQLRDNYIDYSNGPWDVRVGKQQVVWGEAVGSFYADVVNARDYREFVLQDLDQIRIPEWGSDMEYTYKDFHAEAVWIPWPEMDKVARPGAEFAPDLSVPSGVSQRFGDPQTPDSSIKNGEVGGRLSQRFGGWDFSGFILRSWDKTPVYRVEPDFLTGGILLTETHPRQTLDGFSFAKEINDVVYKGEFLYTFKKYFSSTDPAAPFGLLPRDTIEYLVGADYNFGKWTTSSQLGQRIIRDFDESLFNQQQIQTTVAFYVKRSFKNDRLEPELTLIKALETWDLLARPRVNYKFANHWRVAAGFDLMAGPDDGLYGQFSNRSRFTTEVRFDW
jgi:hypothetical protein